MLARQRTRLDCSGQLRSQSKFAGRSCHHGTANSASLHPGPSSPRALSTRQTTHKHHPFTAPIQYPYTQHKHAPAPRSQLALPNASTDQPLYAHRDRDSINTHPIHQTVSAVPQTAVPPHRIARRTTSCVRQPTSCSALPAPPSPLHAHRQIFYCSCIDVHRLRKRRS